MSVSSHAQTTEACWCGSGPKKEEPREGIIFGLSWKPTLNRFNGADTDTPTSRNPTAMRLLRSASTWALSIFLLLSAGACSILGPNEVEIKVLNQSEGPIFLLAWELQSSHLVDPQPAIQLASDDSRVLSPGASRILRPSDVSGEFEFGDDLRLFLYEVLGETAEFRSTLTLTAGDLREVDNRVTIGGLSP